MLMMMIVKMMMILLVLLVVVVEGMVVVVPKGLGFFVPDYLTPKNYQNSVLSSHFGCTLLLLSVVAENRAGNF